MFLPHPKRLLKEREAKRRAASCRSVDVQALIDAGAVTVKKGPAADGLQPRYLRELPRKKRRARKA